MNRVLFLILLITSSLSAQDTGGGYNYFVDNVEIPGQVIADPGEFVSNQLLVMLQPGTSIGPVVEILTEKGFTVVAQKNVSASFSIWLITFEEGIDISKTLDHLKRMSEVEIAQYNHYCAHRSTIPNDAQFGSQWNMNNTGQNGGTADADTDAPEAWDITTGGLTVQGDTIVVAVIDAGFDLAHNDINFWKNYAEIPNNGLDDDNNGYIDDFNGWNAYNSNGVIVSDMHGTHVSGIVGAKGNNSIGVAGVNWGVKIMPIMGSDGTEAQVVEAYTYVFDARKLYNTTNGAQGAFVVSTNSSFGVDQGQPSQYPLWCAMYDSMGVVGILSAAATANANWDIDAVGDIPTACASNYMIGVTNTTRNDVKYTNAGYGATTIDLGAPGTQVMSTLPSNLYGQLTGTSMASPHVAGAVALMWAAACDQFISDYKADPANVGLLMKNYMLASTDPLASLNGTTVSGGRLNLYNALLAVQAYNCNPNAAIQEPNGITGINLIYPDPANNSLNIIFNSNGSEKVVLVFTDLLGQVVKEVDTESNFETQQTTVNVAELAAGTYFVQLRIGAELSGGMRVVISH